MNYLGSKETLALFSDSEYSIAAVVDTSLNIVTELNYLARLADLDWDLDVEPSESAKELAEAALSANSDARLALVASGNSRMYTVPGGVQSEAKKALKWRKEHGRGGTPVGLNTARTLARGGQIGIQKIRHIAKYFPRHEVDKKGKGWEPGEDNFPSNGRIAWALWGGDAAWRWASAIVERENKKAITADGYALPEYLEDISLYSHEDMPYDADIDAFKEAHEMDSSYGPEFMIRVRLDGTGIDRLYKIDIDGSVCFWDDGVWDDLGHVEGDVYTYDAAMDDPYDTCDKEHVLIDPSSALIVSALMQERPFEPVRIEEINPDEARLVAEGLAQEDFALVNNVLLAAGDSMSGIGKTKKSKADADGDGKLDTAFLSQKASSQPRDASGQFVKSGSRVVVGNDGERGRGVITGVNKSTGRVGVKLDSGKFIEVGSKYTQQEDRFKGGVGLVPNRDNTPLDLSGIIGEPRTPKDMPKAHLPGTLPPLTSKGINKMLTDWNGYVKDMRESYKPRNAADAARVKERYGVEKFAGDKSNLPEKSGTPAAKSNLPQNSNTPASKVNLNQGGSTSGTKSNLPQSTTSPAAKSNLPQNANSPVSAQNLKTNGAPTGAPSAAKKSAASSKPADSTPTKFDENGKYVVQKNDSLWSIAEKTKADGQTTEDQWLKILDANKDNLKSGDPNLIFPDERVNVPGQESSGTKKTNKPAAPSTQEKIRQAKQDEARKADESKKRQADAQEKIRQAKQEESRAAKPNAQEGMRKEKQDASRAEAAKKKAAETQDKLTDARNADRLDTTAKAKAKAQADARAGMQADKKAISDAEAAKNKASADQEKLRNARNADRADTTAKNKAKAEADTRAGMQSDKKAMSKAEAKAASDSKARSSVQADKKASSTAETTKARQAAENKVKSGMQADKKASSVTEAKAKADSKARSGVQQAKQSESSGIGETVKNRTDSKARTGVQQAKKADQPAIKEKQVENVRDKFRQKKEFFRQQREKYGTYEDRVKAAKERQETSKFLKD